MRWTRVAPKTRAPARGRRSRVVLTLQRRRQGGGGNSAGDGGKPAMVTGEITKETVKTIARGMPGEPGEPVVTTLVCSFYFACEAAGASRARHSLRPLIEGRMSKAKTRVDGAARSRTRVWTSLRGALATKQSILRHSGAMRSIEPGISRFRVWSFGPSRNDGWLRRKGSL